VRAFAAAEVQASVFNVATFRACCCTLGCLKRSLLVSNKVLEESAFRCRKWGFGSASQQQAIAPGSHACSRPNVIDHKIRCTKY